MQQLVERGFFKSTPIKLSVPNEGMPSGFSPQVQVLRVGKFNHPKYGEFEITTKTLQEMKNNFDNNVRGVDIAFDYFHNSDQEASGWPTELFLTEDQTELWAKVDWTPKARQKLSEREIRYFSPDFAFQWEDPETGVVYKNVLFGGGLTNRPFVKDMAAIVAAEEAREKMTLEELNKKVVKLAEDGDDLAKKHAALQVEHEAMKKKLAEYEASDAAKKDPDADGDDDSSASGDDDQDSIPALKKKLSEMDGRNKDLEKQLADMKSQKQLAEKETKFNLLLSEGKACAAQKQAFLKGDMEEFVKLSQPLNLEGKGSNGNASSQGGDREDRVLKLAEAKCKADPKLSRVDAISMAQKEIKE